MFIALDVNGKRINASEANRKMKYYCPVCGNPVILRSGIQNVEHFAHTANECIDRWNYDMSEWHIKMQGFYSENTREVVVKHNGIIHRADILIENTVIEMQHSSITAEEFKDRNEFFGDLGYRVIWIFDVSDKKDRGQIDYLGDETVTKFKWKNPLRIFNTLERSLTDSDKTFALYLYLYDEEETYIYRVVWTKENDYGEVDLSRFIICEDGINLTTSQDIEEYFIPKKEKREKHFRKKREVLREELTEEGFKYLTKYIGEKGKPREKYTCDKNGKFGLKLTGEKACSYCKHCAMVVEKVDENGGKYAIYCCYPYTYRQPDKNGHPGYECNQVTTLRL